MSFPQLRSLSRFNLQLPPNVTTQAATDITSSSATGNGTVVAAGYSAVTDRGFVWSTSAYPTLADSSVSSGTGTGVFTGSLTSLSASTTYHYRAYATNSMGTSYGEDTEFSTSAGGGTVYPSNWMMMGMG